QQQFYLAGRGVRLLAADLAERQVVSPAEVVERELETSVAVLEGGHGCGPPFWWANVTPTSGGDCRQNVARTLYRARKRTQGLRPKSLYPLQCWRRDLNSH